MTGGINLKRRLWLFLGLTLLFSPVCTARSVDESRQWLAKLNLNYEGQHFFEKIEELIKKYFDVRPAVIIEKFDLRRPIYQQVAAQGHFGRDDLDLPWENTDKAELLRAEL